MVALIMGIASIALTVVSFFGVPVVGWVAIVLGILAWIFGAKAVKADPTDAKSKTGKIIGMVATILAIIGIVIGIIVAATLVAGIAEVVG